MLGIERRRYRDITLSCRLLQLVVRLCVVIDHLLPEVFDLLIGRLLRGELTEFNFGQSSEGSILREFLIVYFGWSCIRSSLAHCAVRSLCLRHRLRGSRLGLACGTALCLGKRATRRQNSGYKHRVQKYCSSH